MSKPWNSRNEWCHFVLFLACAVQFWCHIGMKHKKITSWHKMLSNLFSHRNHPDHQTSKHSNSSQHIMQTQQYETVPHAIHNVGKWQNGKHTYHSHTHTHAHIHSLYWSARRSLDWTGANISYELNLCAAQSTLIRTTIWNYFVCACSLAMDLTMSHATISHNSMGIMYAPRVFVSESYLFVTCDIFPFLFSSTWIYFQFIR